MQIEKTRSRWWFLLPIFLNLAGGVIAYFVLRHEDPAKAKNCLLLGVALFAIYVVSGIVFGALDSEQAGSFVPEFD